MSERNATWAFEHILKILTRTKSCSEGLSGQVYEKLFVIQYMLVYV